MQPKGTVPKVVIVGGGFAGIAALQSLKRSGVVCDIVLLTKGEAFEYYPALYKLVTGALAIEVSVPYKNIKGVRDVQVKQGVFIAVDPARQVIELEDGDEIPYDYLILALGSETNYFNIPGLPELSYSFKSVKEAFRLKRHFCNLFAEAAILSRTEAVAKLHTVIVGAGPSGVELAGDLTHYLRALAKGSGVDPSLITVDLVESAPRVLSVLPEKVSRTADQRLRRMGVNIYTNRAVTSQDIFSVSMGTMNFQSSTVIWTAGTRINSAYKHIPGATTNERGRIIVDQHLALPSDNHIFILGDGAATPYSGLAQTAIHDGKFLGKHLASLIRGGKGEIYHPAPVSFVIPIGNFWALFVHGRMLWKGFIPWFLRSAVDFRYFLSLVPLWYVFDVFRQGYKYRRSKTYCPIE